MELNRWPRSGLRMWSVLIRLFILLLLVGCLSGYYLMELGYFRITFAVEYQNYVDEDAIPNDGVEYEEFLVFSKEKT